MSRYNYVRIYERCGDCGGAIGERNSSMRPSICDECWNNRGWLLENRTKIDLAEFQKIQRSMASRRGIAKERIEKLKQVVAQ